MKKYFVFLCMFLILATFLYASFDDLFMDESFFRVEEQLVVTASRRAQSITEAPATIYVITDREIEQFGFVDLKDVIKIIPGMIVEDGSYGQLYGGQRGFTGIFQKTLLMINGREMNNILANEAFIGPQFPLHNVQRIEVIAGPGSALYGANAFAGVINIITKDAATINGAEASYTYGGTTNTNLYTLSYGKSTDNADITFNARIKKAGGYDFGDYVSDVKRFNAAAFRDWEVLDDGRIWNPGNGLVWRTPNTHGDRYENPEHTQYYDAHVEYHLNNDFLKSIYGGLNVYNMTTGHGMTKTQWLNYEGSDHRETYLYYAGFKRDFHIADNLIETRFEFRYTNEYTWGNHTCEQTIKEMPSHLDPDLDGSGYGVPADPPVWWYDFPVVDDDGDPSTPYTPTKTQIERYRGYWSNRKSDGSKRYYAEFQASTELYLMGRVNNIVAGLVFDRKEATHNPWSLWWNADVQGPRVDYDKHPDVPDSALPDDIKQRKIALFLQNQVNFMEDRLLATVGFRFDHHSNDGGDDLSYGGIFNPRLGLVYKFSDLDTFKFLYGSAFREASPFENVALDPEKMQTIELGYHRRTRDRRIENQINVYYNMAEDFISNLPTVDPETGRVGYGYANSGKVNVLGFENVFTYNPSDRLRATFVFTYQKPEMDLPDFPTFDIACVPQKQANFRLSWNVYRNINIGWITRWSDKVNNYVDPAEPDGNNTNPISSIDSYMVHDINILAKRVMGSNPSTDQLVDVALTIRNIFDTDYENSNNRYAGAHMESPTVFGQPGRTIYFNVTTKF